MLKNISEKLLYYVSIQTKKFELPTMMLRKGIGGQYLIDKLNPKYFDERFFNRENFFSPENVFKKSSDAFFNKIQAMAREEEAKKEKEPFNSSESSLVEKVFLRKRENVNIEKSILEQRLSGVAQASSVQESLFEDLKFSEVTFCERFLKKIKNK